MKKLTLSAMIVVMIFAFNSSIFAQFDSSIETSSTELESTKPEESAAAIVLKERLAEIEKMDMSSMNSAEKKELKTEVKTIKKELKNIGSGVYLSVGAIIIIILLLILLL
jgi:hypothetical protein